ncbi:proline-rich protein HaeIII subfamily 1-like [Brienomyrus brachyistius]|uniref:proline-rich protein HaeIII subfamily 1-like n=1 Tax=Brienomyrus brachyistius TaxID=42636 RepID=UPI0020B4113D|nr:proline-rich protein HaeIII subfamily 1-like [Brienomyrus brachyistius]
MEFTITKGKNRCFAKYDAPNAIVKAGSQWKFAGQYFVRSIVHNFLTLDQTLHQCQKAHSPPAKDDFCSPATEAEPEEPRESQDSPDGPQGPHHGAAEPRTTRPTALKKRPPTPPVGAVNWGAQGRRRQPDSRGPPPGVERKSPTLLHPMDVTPASSQEWDSPRSTSKRRSGPARQALRPRSSQTLQPKGPVALRPCSPKAPPLSDLTSLRPRHPQATSCPGTLRPPTLRPCSPQTQPLSDPTSLRPRHPQVPSNQALQPSGPAVLRPRHSQTPPPSGPSSPKAPQLSGPAALKPRCSQTPPPSGPGTLRTPALKHCRPQAPPLSDPTSLRPQHPQAHSSQAQQP